MMYLFASIMALLSVSGAMAPCDLDANIVVIADGSASVADSDFGKTKSFLAELFAQFKPMQSSGNLKMGLTQFSDDITVEAPLTTNLDSLVTAANAMVQKKGNTNTREAYLSGLSQLKASTPATSNTQKIIVYLTDGLTDGGWVAKLNKMVNYTAPDAAFASQFSTAGIKIIDLGLGSKWSMDEFLTMTERSLVQEAGFDTLHYVTNRIKNLACTMEHECIGECTGKQSTGTLGANVVFKNNFNYA